MRNPTTLLTALVLIALTCGTGAQVIGGGDTPATPGQTTAAPAGGADALEGTAGPAQAPPAGPGSGADALEGGGATEEPAVRCDGQGPCIETGTQLPLRALPRPLSNLYAERTQTPDGIVQANVRAFHPLYVYAREGLDLSDPGNPKGWYRVGATSTAPQGWMRAADLLEWRQALLVSYTHPGGVDDGRRPVLMFRDLPSLRRVVDGTDRAEQAEALYRRVEAKDVPDELVSMEPKRFVDITRHFYILPIVRFDSVTLDGDDARLSAGRRRRPRRPRRRYPEERRLSGPGGDRPRRRRRCPGPGPKARRGLRAGHHPQHPALHRLHQGRGGGHGQAPGQPGDQGPGALRPGGLPGCGGQGPGHRVHGAQLHPGPGGCRRA